MVTRYIRMRLSVVVRRCRQNGWRGVLEMLRYNLYKRERVVRLRLDLSDWRCELPRPPAQMTRRGDAEDLARFRDAWQDSRLPDFLNVDRLYGVQWFYLAYWHDQPAHITWVFAAGQRTPHIKLSAGEVELQYVYTLPAYRGRGIFSAALGSLLGDLQREGIKTVYAHVADGNEPSLRGFRRLGFVSAGKLRETRVLGASIQRFVPCPPPR